MTPMTEHEWGRVQEALVKGGLRQCIDEILTSRLSLSDDNRRIIERAYDDGCGHSVTLVPADDYPWFAGMYDGEQIYMGMEHHGTLYSIVTLSGDNIYSVIVGRGLIENDMGVVFRSVDIAKAYVKGLTAK